MTRDVEGGRGAGSPGGGEGRSARASLARRLGDLERRYRALAPWLLFRAEDGVLILPPNRVYKLGGSGAKVLAWLAGGGRLGDIPGMDHSRAADLDAFLLQVEDASAGRPVELGRVPYDFSFTRLPVIGELALTYRCNAACLFCYAGCGEATADVCGSDRSRARASRKRVSGAPRGGMASWSIPSIHAHRSMVQ